MVTVKIAADSEIGRLLREAEAAGEPLRIDTGEATYTIRRDDAERSHSSEGGGSVRRNYDPDRLRENLRSWAGTLSEEEAAAFKQYIYEVREAGTRGLDRP